jgi:hypothetical protein
MPSALNGKGFVFREPKAGITHVEKHLPLRVFCVVLAFAFLCRSLCAPLKIPLRAGTPSRS